MSNKEDEKSFSLNSIFFSKFLFTVSKTFQNKRFSRVSIIDKDDIKNSFVLFLAYAWKAVSPFPLFAEGKAGTVANDNHKFKFHSRK